MQAVMVRLIASNLNSQQYVSKSALNRVWQRKQMIFISSEFCKRIQESELADVLIVRINTAIESSNKPRLTNYLKTKIDMWFFF